MGEREASVGGSSLLLPKFRCSLDSPPFPLLFFFPCHIEFDFLLSLNYISTIFFLFLFYAFIKKNGKFNALSLII